MVASKPSADGSSELSGRGPGPSARTWLVRGCGFYALLAALGWAWRSGLYGEPVFYSSLEAAIHGPSWVSDLGIGVGAGLLLVGLSNLYTEKTASGKRLADRLAEVLANLPVGPAIALALVSSIGEEVFFRGALQPRVGWIVASLLFGLVHVGPGKDFLPWTLSALFAGLLLGGLFLYTGNLAAPIAAHAVVNGVNLPMLARRGRALRSAAQAAASGPAAAALREPE